jgi:DNA-binding CsgD family transcriptional regulator
MSLRLTETEARVMRLASAGLKAEEIAEALDLSRGVVVWHLTQSYKKLGVGSQPAPWTGGSPCADSHSSS